MAKKKTNAIRLKSLAELQENIDEQAERQRQYEKAMQETPIDDAMQAIHREEWERVWMKLNEGVIDYMKGGSSQWMVENICALDAIVDELALGKRLESLRDIDDWPTFTNDRDRNHVSVCKIVIEVWALIRFEGADADDLVKALDENKARQAIEEVGFLRRVVEAGGLPACQQCEAALPPWDVLRGRCEACRRGDRTSLMALHTAIECEHRSGSGSVYTGGIVAHIPQWDRWRKRLLDYVGKVDDTDHDLLKVWTTYVRRHHGIDESQFLMIQFDDAEALLPPPKATFLARDRHSTIIDPTQGLTAVTAGTTFRPETCDDDLWLQLDVCIRAMENAEGGPCYVLESCKIGTASDSKYLQNVNQIAVQAGWEPFVFPFDNGFRVLRRGGEEVCYRRNPGSYAKDELAGEAVLSALRAWREKRARELQVLAESATGNPTHPIEGQGVTPPKQSNPKSKTKRVASEPLESMGQRELDQLAIIADLHLQWLQAGRKPKTTSASFDDWLRERGYQDGKRRYAEDYRHHNTLKSRHGYSASGTTKTDLKEALEVQQEWVEAVKSAIDRLGL